MSDGMSDDRREERREKRLHAAGAAAARAGEGRYTNPWREDRGAWEAWDDGWTSVAGDRDPEVGSRWRFGLTEVEVVLCGWCVGFLGQFLGSDCTAVVYREVEDVDRKLRVRHVREFHRYFVPSSLEAPRG